MKPLPTNKDTKHRCLTRLCSTHFSGIVPDFTLQFMISRWTCYIKVPHQIFSFHVSTAIWTVLYKFVTMFQQVKVIYFCNLKTFRGKTILFFITFIYMHSYFDLRVNQCFRYHYTHCSSLDPSVVFSPNPIFWTV
jgi:hypothetical protein